MYMVAICRTTVRNRPSTVHGEGSGGHDRNTSLGIMKGSLSPLWLDLRPKDCRSWESWDCLICDQQLNTSDSALQFGIGVDVRSPSN